MAARPSAHARQTCAPVGAALRLLLPAAGVFVIAGAAAADVCGGQAARPALSASLEAQLSPALRACLLATDEVPAADALTRHQGTRAWGPLLATIVADRSTHGVIRQRALGLLSRLATPAADSAIAASLRDRDPRIRAVAAVALTASAARRRPGWALAQIRRSLSDREPTVRLASARALALLPPHPAVAEVVTRALRDERASSVRDRLLSLLAR